MRIEGLEEKEEADNETLDWCKEKVSSILKSKLEKKQCKNRTGPHNAYKKKKP